MKRICVNKNKMRKEIVKWSVYWAVILFVYALMSIVYGNGELYAPVLVFATVNFALRLALILPSKAIPRLSLRLTAVISANIILLFALCFWGYEVITSGSDRNDKFIRSLDYGVFEHNSEYRYDEQTGVYTLRSNNNEFKILQLTDIHLGAGVSTGSLDRKALSVCYESIKQTQPDFIIVTGDIAYAIPLLTFSNNNMKPMKQFCEFMNNVGIPWVVEYGNHDIERYATHTADELAAMYRELKTRNAPLLFSDVQPDIDGRYNQYIRVENGDGTLNRILFIMDSNDYADIGGYDSVHADQIEWYADTVDKLREIEGESVRSFVYMHIPFCEFDDAWKAVESGSPDAQYLFGSNKEKVCCSEENSGFFDMILEKNHTDAVFVGHDHLNNMAVKYKGVDLVYSKSVDCLAYPQIAHSTAQRGATLVTLAYSGEYVIEQIDYAK